MLAAQRRDLLLDRLRTEGRLVAKDLATEFGVSEDSVRRDLRELRPPGCASGCTAARCPCHRPSPTTRRGSRWPSAARPGSPPRLQP